MTAPANPPKTEQERIEDTARTIRTLAEKITSHDGADHSADITQLEFFVDASKKAGEAAVDTLKNLKSGAYSPSDVPHIKEVTDVIQSALDKRDAPSTERATIGFIEGEAFDARSYTTKQGSNKEAEDLLSKAVEANPKAAIAAIEHMRTAEIGITKENRAQMDLIEQKLKDAGVNYHNSKPQQDEKVVRELQAVFVSEKEMVNANTFGIDGKYGTASAADEKQAEAAGKRYVNEDGSLNKELIETAFKKDYKGASIFEVAPELNKTLKPLPTPVTEVAKTGHKAPAVG